MRVPPDIACLRLGDRQADATRRHRLYIAKLLLIFHRVLPRRRPRRLRETELRLAYTIETCFFASLLA